MSGFTISGLLSLCAPQMKVDVVAPMLVEEGEVCVLQMIRSKYEPTDICTMYPVSFAIFASLAFCVGGEGINVKSYAMVLELPPVIGKMYPHTSDTRVGCVIMCLIEISGMDFVRYDQFGHVLIISDN